MRHQRMMMTRPAPIQTSSADAKWRTNDLFDNADGGDVLGMAPDKPRGGVDSVTQPIAPLVTPRSPLSARLQAQRDRVDDKRRARILASQAEPQTSSLLRPQSALLSPDRAPPSRTTSSVAPPPAAAPRFDSRFDSRSDSDDDETLTYGLEERAAPRSPGRTASRTTSGSVQPPAPIPPRAQRALDEGFESRGSASSFEDGGDAGVAVAPEGDAAAAGEAPIAAVHGAGTAAGGGRGARPDDRLDGLLASSTKAFVSAPGPLFDAMQCFVVREKGTPGLLKKAQHVYKLYHEASGQLLLAARRRSRTKTASYVISLDANCIDRASPSYCGKIRSNFLGTEFWIYDHRERSLEKARSQSVRRQRLQMAASDPWTVQTSRPSDGDDGAEAGRCELAVVQYQLNVMGTSGPRKMLIGLPYVDPEDNSAVVMQPERPADSMMHRLKQPSDDMLTFVNKVPKWNQQLGAYCLNFGGRVTQASVKNFQLVRDQDDERDVLQFGRVDSNKFTLDYRWPMTAFQAFCIAVTSLDSKLACE